MDTEILCLEVQGVAGLGCFSRADIHKAGGKGSNLGELIQAGFHVPDGFVITTDVYDEFVQYNRLASIIAQAVVGKSYDGASIKAAIERSLIPPDIEQEILEAYTHLGQGAVAVRSSATAEDLPGMAFAGQQDTYLNVIGPQALLDAVRKCWASLWSERAIAYRERQSLDHQGVKIAVVVQRLVPAEVAGVMFTANPVTGARDELIIDANPGLGEAVVSGRVTPDHIVLRQVKGTWRIKERSVGRREVVVRPSVSGGTEDQVGGSEKVSSALPKSVLFELGHLGADIERHFGSPQDIEWAWQAGKLYILQARPITALPSVLLRPTKPVQMLSAIFAEMLPIRPYPLDMTTWMKALSAAAVEPIFSMIGFTPPAFEQLFGQEEGVVTAFKGQVSVRPSAALLLAPARLPWLALRYDPAKWRNDPLLLDAIQRARQLAGLQITALSWTELLDAIKEALKLPRPLAGEMRRRYIPRALFNVAGLATLLKVLGYSRYLGTLLSGAESETIAANQALEDLAEKVRADASLSKVFANTEPEELGAALQRFASGKAFLAELKRFMDRFGHREVVAVTVLEPTWQDAPQVVLGIIRGMAGSEPPKHTTPAWQLARDEILTHPWLKFKPLRALFIRLLAGARWLWRIREDTHFMATILMPILRRLELELGQHLSCAGVIDEPSDIFHLKLDELERLDGSFPLPAVLVGEIRDLVLHRKQKRQSLEGLPVVDPKLFQQDVSYSNAVLRGTPGSPGIAEGTVRVIHDISEFGKLLPGEVLVAPYTNPAWTLLFQRAAAIIVDGGAAGSHAAIVAREYGVPAVMGTVKGTQVLHDGDWVLVDGTNGIVQLSQPRGELILVDRRGSKS